MTSFIFDGNQRLTTSFLSVASQSNGFPFDSSGGLVVANGTAAPSAFSNGIPFDGTAVAIDSTNAIANYANGIPMTANGRIACSISTPIDGFSNGLPFVNGKIAVTSVGSSAPNMQTVVASAVADLDATVTESYTSGQTWANLVLAPADGAAQTAYDFWLGTDGSGGASDPTFTGSGTAAYFAIDGGDWFTHKSATTLTNNMHKTTGGNAWSVAFIAQVTAKSIPGAAGGFIGNNANADSVTEGYCFTNGNFFDFGNRVALKGTGAGFSGFNGTTTGGETSDGTTKFFAMTYDPSTRAVKTYVASGSPVSFTGGFYSSTANPTYALQIAATGNGNTPMAAGSRVKAVSLYNAILSDADIAAIRAEYSTRHGASY